jgi:ABC-type branched-subunit amino acid transport system substrate-binding protein
VVAPGAASGRGPIKVGALTATGAAKYQKSLGFSAGASGDQVAMTRSVVNYINAHGGLGGRKIELVFYDLDPGAVVADASSAYQAACTYFTQDKKVVAVASLAALAPASFYECMAQARVPMVIPDEGFSTDFFQRFADTVYMPPAPSYTRLLTESVDALWQAGWLTSKSKVGLVGYDTVDVHAIVDKGLLPALKRRGLSLTASAYTSTTTAAASEYNSAVLSFNTKGVDRVFFAPGGQPIYFALAAEQQGYRPHYALGSLEYPNALAETLPSGQLAGSAGLGWSPYFDLPRSEQARVSTPGIAACRTAMASANQDYSTGTTLGIAAWICDDWMFLRDVFAAGATPDQAGIRRAAEALGATFHSASTFRTLFQPTRPHDGAGAYRLMAYQEACGCYRYTSPVRGLP